MTDLESTLRRSLAELDHLDARVALVGGLAVSVTAEDRELAAEACAAIVARGFGRDRDLVAALREALDG